MPPQPRFVNLQSSPVGVYVAKGKKVYVQPFADIKHSRSSKDVFVLTGEQYADQVAPRGPLAPFPDTAEAEAALAAFLALDAKAITAPQAGAEPVAPILRGGGAPAAGGAATAASGSVAVQPSGTADPATEPAKPAIATAPETTKVAPTAPETAKSATSPVAQPRRTGLKP